MARKVRSIRTPEFKARVALAAVQGQQTTAQLATLHGVHGVLPPIPESTENLARCARSTRSIWRTRVTVRGASRRCWRRGSGGESQACAAADAADEHRRCDAEAEPVAAASGSSGFAYLLRRYHPDQALGARTSRGPIFDRIDCICRIKTALCRRIFDGDQSSEPSEELRNRVIKSRETQRNRFEYQRHSI